MFTTHTAFLGLFDFIYCMPDAWLSVPFTFLGTSNFNWGVYVFSDTGTFTHGLFVPAVGIIAEAGSSVSFVNRSEWSCLGRFVVREWVLIEDLYTRSGPVEGKRSIDFREENGCRGTFAMRICQVSLMSGCVVLIWVLMILLHVVKSFPSRVWNRSTAQYESTYLNSSKRWITRQCLR